MRITEVIERIKDYCKGGIDEDHTRDRILFGNPDQECTGVVTTVYAGIDVIRKALSSGSNLIICHETLFWNHGDHTEWLQESQNRTYLAKKALLEEGNIVVWRIHDYIHSGIPVKGQYCDGIFYGLMHEIGYDEEFVKGGGQMKSVFSIREISAEAFGEKVKKVCGLNGARIIGNRHASVRKIMAAFHIWGIPEDNALIEKVERENIDLIIAGETTDFTVLAYMNDAGKLNHNRAVLSTGHFNIEEPGMKYMLEYLPALLENQISVRFFSAGDMYYYL